MDPAAIDVFSPEAVPLSEVVTPARRAGGLSQRVRGIVLGTLSTGLWLALWQIASRQKWDFFFRFENVPAPTDVLLAFTELVSAPKFALHVANSIRRIFWGFSVASVLGVGLGLVIGRFRLASEALLPPLEVLRPIPAVAWIPIAILLFASPEDSMVFITFIGAFFPVLLSTIHGVETLDRRLVYAAVTLGAGPIDVFREVILPGALPSVVTGLSIGMGTSWFSLVTAEMISGQYGIGYYTWEAYTLQKYPSIVVGMVSIGVLGMGSSALVKWIGHRFMPWFKPETIAA
ncbi:MAG TPA: ABC transporter permease [Polyangiaceae bacterium]|nr:ABC transporter permease [Polyangiaceae bacterium]